MLLSQGTFTPGFDVMPIATPYPGSLHYVALRADGGVGLREADGSGLALSHCLSSLGDGSDSRFLGKQRTGPAWLALTKR